MSTGIIKRANM
jgi:hypothetical protein